MSNKVQICTIESTLCELSIVMNKEKSSVTL